MASWATAEIQGGGIGVGGTLPVLSSVEKRTMVRILWGATDFGTLLLKPSLANQVDKVWRRTSGENGAWPHWPLQETDPALARARVVAFFGLLDGTPPPKRVSPSLRLPRLPRLPPSPALRLLILDDVEQ